MRRAKSSSSNRSPPQPREIRDIERIRNMLNSPGSTIEMLTCGSAKGFMFEMTVDPRHSEFSNLGGERITSFIVKLAVTSQQNDEELDDYVPVNRGGTPVGKSTESAESYFQEAKIQQDVWMTTVTGNRLPVSPPIVSFSLFDNENGKNFLTFLNYKVKKPKSVHTINYLRRVLQNPVSDYGVGMIIMSKVLHSDTFENFLDLARNSRTSFQGVQVTDQVVSEVYAKLISKIVRLYIEVGVIHFDLHLKNALVYLNGDNSLNVYIIDYGRASDVKDATTNEYLGPAEKRPLHAKSEALREKVLDLCHPGKRRPPNPQEKIKFISDVIDPLRTIEHAKSQQLYGNPDSYPYGRYQFDWMEEITPMLQQMLTRQTTQATQDMFNSIAVMTFDNLCREITLDIARGSHLSRATLQQSCVNFKNRTPSEFQTPFLATWTEWAHSILPRIGRKLSSLVSRHGGKKRKTNVRRTTRKMHKLHKLHKLHKKRK